MHARRWQVVLPLLISVLATAALTGGAAASDNSVPIGTHDGAIDQIAAHGTCYANGWAADPDDLETDLTVRILADGEIVAAVVAGDFRQDLLDAGIGDGTASFWVDLGPLISADVPHEIRVQARDLQTGTWSDVDSTPRSITCTHLFGSHDTPASAFERKDCVVEGWAFDADTPSGPRAQVRIKVDGRIVAETTANLFREDVRDAGFGDGFSGWRVNLWGHLAPGKTAVVTAETRDTTAKRIWVPLQDTGKTMTCNAIPDA